VLFIIENNKYGMGTDIRRTTSIDRLWKRALAFDMAHSDVDGMNVLSVYDHVKDIVATMRKDKRPYLLEALTYRYRGHSVSDPATYRSKEELQEYMTKDPILQLGEFLKSEKIAEEEQLKAWTEEAKAEVKEAEKFADEADEPEIHLAFDHNYAE